MTRRTSGTVRAAALALAASAMLATGCANAGTRLSALQATQPDVYRLGAGDELRISVPGLDAMNNTYRVDDTGTIAIPMLDPVKVAGLSIREVEGAISKGISDRQLVLSPQVSAQIVSYRPFYIAGEVQKPGQYAYVPGMSLMTAVAIAGGYTFRANTRVAVVTRAPGNGTISKGKVTSETPILPGDQIVIRESWF